jgi:hypothetical protein
MLPPTKLKTAVAFGGVSKETFFCSSGTGLFQRNNLGLWFF